MMRPGAGEAGGDGLQNLPLLVPERLQQDQEDRIAGGPEWDGCKHMHRREDAQQKGHCSGSQCGPDQLTEIQPPVSQLPGECDVR